MYYIEDIDILGVYNYIILIVKKHLQIIILPEVVFFFVNKRIGLFSFKKFMLRYLT